MLDIGSKLRSVALIARLVNRAPTPPGRTAIMKYLYFMKTLKGVPVPYRFSLYTYGPFDSDVLDDLRYAEALGAVESELVPYPGGRGYEYKRGPQLEMIEERANDFLARHVDDIDWVLGEFGDRSASELEMASTLVYVDRSVADKGERATIAALAKKVHDVKPHLPLGAIENEARRLSEGGHLKSVQ